MKKYFEGAAERGASALGIDFAPAQVELARRHYPGVTFEQGDATALRFKPQSFDCVINGIGMPHFENPDAAISEAFRVLRPGGSLLSAFRPIPLRRLVLA